MSVCISSPFYVMWQISGGRPAEWCLVTGDWWLETVEVTSRWLVQISDVRALAVVLLCVWCLLGDVASWCWTKKPDVRCVSSAGDSIPYTEGTFAWSVVCRAQAISIIQWKTLPGLQSYLIFMIDDVLIEDPNFCFILWTRCDWDFAIFQKLILIEMCIVWCKSILCCFEAHTNLYIFCETLCLGKLCYGKLNILKVWTVKCELWCTVWLRPDVIYLCVGCSCESVLSEL